MARFQIGSIERIRVGVFIAGEQMAEEALLGALEGRAGGGLGLPVQRAGRAGDVGGLHRRVEIVVDDGEGPGIGVVDARCSGVSACSTSSYSTPS
jgi:hypothetical protein